MIQAIDFLHNLPRVINIWPRLFISHVEMTFNWDMFMHNLTSILGRVSIEASRPLDSR